MGAVIFIFALVSVGLLAAFSESVEPTRLNCRRAIQHEVRIRGCQQQPCTIRKGERLPYEVDFTFTGPPVQGDEFSFSVFISYYGPPPGYYGSDLSNFSCRDGRCGMLYPNRKYTFRNSLYVDPSSRCTAGCEGMNSDGTGTRSTHWRYSIRDSRSNVTDGTESGLCWFDLDLNIIN